jgi:hypothetical protein
MLTHAGKPDSHESPFKYKFELLYDFSVSVVYFRFGDGSIGKGWTQVGAAFGANCSTRLCTHMVVYVLLELTGHHPLFCHHHDKTQHRERLWKEKQAESEPHTPAPFRKTPAMDMVAMETQPMESKPAPAEQTQPLAEEGLSQQPPEVILASTPAVVQPIQFQPLADEVSDEGHA